MNSGDPVAFPDASDSEKKVRPLEGLVVGISVGLGEDSARHGFGEEEMNRAVVRLSDALLSTGARLVFGHDWRPSGVMSAVARLAVTYDASTAGSNEKSGENECRITNLVPWDRRPELPRELRNDLEERGMLRIEEVPLPHGLEKHEGEFGRRVLRAAGLCHLRRRLAELCDARICLGGKLREYEGFFPGILEEAFNSASRDRGNKVLLSGLLGGAAEKVLKGAVAGEWDALTQVKDDEELRGGYEKLRAMDANILPDFRQIPKLLNWSRLQDRSGLTIDDWERLTEAHDIEIVSTLAIKALSNRG